MRKKGFTLIELIVVITIIAILATIILVAYTGSQSRARDAKRKSDIQAIAGALDLKFADNNVYNLNANTWSCFPASWQRLADNIKGYLNPLPNDPKLVPASECDITQSPWNHSEDYFAYVADTFPTFPIASLPERGAYPNVNGYCLSANLENSSGNGDDYKGKICGGYGTLNNKGQVKPYSAGRPGNLLFIMEKHLYKN